MQGKAIVISPEELLALIADYKSGATLTELGQKYGMDRNTARRKLGSVYKIKRHTRKEIEKGSYEWYRKKECERMGKPYKRLKSYD